MRRSVPNAKYLKEIEESLLRSPRGLAKEKRQEFPLLLLIWRGIFTRTNTSRLLMPKSFFFTAQSSTFFEPTVWDLPSSPGSQSVIQ